MITADDYLTRIALERGISPGDQAALDRAVAGEFGMPFVTLAGRQISGEILSALPRSYVLGRSVLPFACEGGVLQVAVADPLAVDVIDGLGHATGRPIQLALASAEDLRCAIARNYGQESDDLSGNDLQMESPTDTLVVSGQDGSASDRDAPIIRLVRFIITEAIRLRASDIHLEPLAHRFRVRYRIDGVLIEVDAPPKHLQPAVISRLKIMANISIAERRVPQDGRIQFQAEGRTLDLRVSSLPTAHGESMVLRILEQENLRLGMPELGFLPDDRELFTRQIASPDGIVLVTGPTGSGKTTTLYASLHHLNQADRKIITVEEPVEYQLAGINQVPVNTEIGMTFAAALRAMLRQSPNIVMVGEIRDLETAEIAINASLTGHFVFSTLHTNDAPSAVTRLIDLGARPFLIAAALRSVMAQRLVRRICPQCRRTHVPSVSELHVLGVPPSRLAGATFARGAGCPACHGTGYRGRMGLFEIFLVDDEIRSMIYDNVTAPRLRQQARQNGMRTMREDGIRKVLAGLTTIEEIASVTASDQP